MSAYTDSMSPEAIATTKTNIRILKEYIIVWLAVLIWDTLATLPAEWKYIHRAKWTPLKIMFLINRWYTIAAQASTAFLLLAPLSPQTCRKIFWGFATDGIAVMFFCDCIIAIRVYAVYEKSKKILYLLIVMLATDLGLMIGAATQLRPVVFSPALRDALDFEGCAAVIPNGEYTVLISVLYWSPPLVFNAVSLGLIFYRNLELSRQAGRIPIIQRMLKDGLFFFSVIMAANIVNVILVASQSSFAIKNLNVPASLTLTSLMCSRLVLSLHQHNSDVRKSQIGYGGSMDKIGSVTGGGSNIRQTQISCRSQTRRPTTRSRLDDFTEEEDDRETEGNTTANEEAESSETVNDKFRYTVRLEGELPPLTSASPQSDQVSPSTPGTPRLSGSPTLPSRRRDSMVSFVTP